MLYVQRSWILISPDPVHTRARFGGYIGCRLQDVGSTGGWGLGCVCAVCVCIFSHMQHATCHYAPSIVQEAAGSWQLAAGTHIATH